MLLGMARPTSGSARLRARPTISRASVDIRRRTGFVSDDKDLYDFMTVAEMIRFTAPFFPPGAPTSNSNTCRIRAAADRRVKALSRGMRTKLALLLALCRGAELLILDEPTSGLDPAMTEEVLQALVAPRRQRGDDGVLLVAPARRSRSDRRSRRDRRSRPHWRGRARSTICASSYRRIQLVFDGDAPQPSFAAPGVVRVKRKGRVLTVLSSAGAEPMLEEARALARSRSTSPGHAEGNLSRDRRDGGLTCSGTKRGSKPAGASSSGC